MFTGNRGCLVDGDRSIVRHHRGPLWITCVPSFRDRRHPLDAPHRWTPLFFLDDAVALAAGHRPCARCRPDAYRSYRDAVSTALAADAPVRAAAIDRRLVAERLRRGGGLARAGDRRPWTAAATDVPDGTVVVRGGAPRLLVGDRTFAFSFDGWTPSSPRPGGVEVRVLTPPTSVAALRHGFVPVLHPSAGSSTM
jgi:hypothetical protein